MTEALAPVAAQRTHEDFKICRSDIAGHYGLTDHDRYPGKKAAWNHANAATLAAAEPAAPEVLQSDRYDRHGTARNDFFDARAESVDLSVAGDATLGEYAHDIPCFQFGVHFLERFIHQLLVFFR